MEKPMPLGKPLDNIPLPSPKLAAPPALPDGRASIGALSKLPNPYRHGVALDEEYWQILNDYAGRTDTIVVRAMLESDFADSSSLAANMAGVPKEKQIAIAPVFQVARTPEGSILEKGSLVVVRNNGVSIANADRFLAVVELQDVIAVCQCDITA